MKLKFTIHKLLTIFVLIVAILLIAIVTTNGTIWLSTLATYAGATAPFLLAGSRGQRLQKLYIGSKIEFTYAAAEEHNFPIDLDGWITRITFSLECTGVVSHNVFVGNVLTVHDDPEEIEGSVDSVQNPYDVGIYSAEEMFAYYKDNEDKLMGWFTSLTGYGTTEVYTRYCRKPVQGGQVLNYHLGVHSNDGSTLTTGAYDMFVELELTVAPNEWKYPPSRKAPLAFHMGGHLTEATGHIMIDTPCDGYFKNARLMLTGHDATNDFLFALTTRGGSEYRTDASKVADTDAEIVTLNKSSNGFVVRIPHIETEEGNPAPALNFHFGKKRLYVNNHQPISFDYSGKEDAVNLNFFFAADFIPFQGATFTKFIRWDVSTDEDYIDGMTTLLNLASVRGEIKALTTAGTGHITVRRFAASPQSQVTDNTITGLHGAADSANFLDADSHQEYGNQIVADMMLSSALEAQVSKFSLDELFAGEQLAVDLSFETSISTIVEMRITGIVKDRLWSEEGEFLDAPTQYNMNELGVVAQ